MLQGETTSSLSLRRIPEMRHVSWWLCCILIVVLAMMPPAPLLAEVLFGHQTADDSHDAFQAFMIHYGKRYRFNEAERERRFALYMHNKRSIERYNAHHATHQLALNSFADLSAAEFRQTRRYAGFRKDRAFALRQQQHSPATATPDWTSNATLHASLPASVDWRVKGCVTPVEHQGECGSCWAFSATGAIEGAYCNKHRTLLSLSTQQVLDCSSREGNSGCTGGVMDMAYVHLIRRSSGLCAKDTYPYTGEEGMCQEHRCRPLASIERFVHIQPNSDVALMAALAYHGPVSAALQSTDTAFQFYHSGILDAPCGDDIDHGVLIVGYGTDPETKLDYWIVKNSWGPEWGENGYVRLRRGASAPFGGQCGILLVPSYAVVH